MLKECIFIGPVISCDALYCLALCLTSNVFIQLRLIWVLSFSRSRKMGYLKKCDIYYFGWLFLALQFSKRAKGLYKMNNNSIYGFLIN